MINKPYIKAKLTPSLRWKTDAQEGISVSEWLKPKQVEVNISSDCVLGLCLEYLNSDHLASSQPLAITA